MTLEDLEAFLDAAADRVAKKVVAELAKQPGKNPNELLSVPQIAKEYGVSPTQVRAWINNGTLPRVPDIALMRVKRFEVDAFATRKE